jgi:uncharacterized protein YjhX (UPF0386 family)
MTENEILLNLAKHGSVGCNLDVKLPEVRSLEKRGLIRWITCIRYRITDEGLRHLQSALT